MGEGERQPGGVVVEDGRRRDKGTARSGTHRQRRGMRIMEVHRRRTGSLLRPAVVRETAWNGGGLQWVEAAGKQREGRPTRTGVEMLT